MCAPKFSMVHDNVALRPTVAVTFCSVPLNLGSIFVVVVVSVFDDICEFGPAREKHKNGNNYFPIRRLVVARTRLLKNTRGFSICARAGQTTLPRTVGQDDTDRFYDGSHNAATAIQCCVVVVNNRARFTPFLGRAPNKSLFGTTRRRSQFN